MTFLGAVVHTLPYLIPRFPTATLIAAVVVGGVIVFVAGILIGSS